MSIDLNHVTVIGNLVRDPELTYTTNGKAVCKFSIAVNDDYGDKKVAYFFDITAWGKSGENVNTYLKKGSKVGVGGKLQQDRWEDKDTGQKRSKVRITAHTVQFLTPKGDNGGGGGEFHQSAENPSSASNPPPAPTGAQAPPPEDDSDIPF